MPIESLFLMLLAPDLFAVDLLAVVATQHSLGDAPFAQAGWVALVIFGAATLLSVVGWLNNAASHRPMPAPGGYRAIIKESSNNPPVRYSTSDSPKPSGNTLLFIMTRNDAIQQLWMIGIVIAGVLLFLTPLPIWLSGLFPVVGFSMGFWYDIAIFPSNTSKGSGLLSLRYQFGVCYLYMFVFLLSISSAMTHHVPLDFLVVASTIAVTWVSLLILLGFARWMRVFSTPQKSRDPSPILLYTQLGAVLTFFNTVQSGKGAVDFIPLAFTVLIFLWIVTLLGVHVVSAIRALRLPTQPEVAA